MSIFVFLLSKAYLRVARNNKSNKRFLKKIISRLHPSASRSQNAIVFLSHEKFEKYTTGFYSPKKIRPIFINCVDARRHVTNRFTKCVIAFGFNARPRERHHTRHPANRILLAHSRMNEHKGGREGGGELQCGSCVVWDTRFTFWNPRRQRENDERDRN